MAPNTPFTIPPLPGTGTDQDVVNWYIEPVTKELRVNPISALYRKLNADNPELTSVPHYFLKEFGNAPVNAVSSIEALISKYNTDSKRQVLINKLSKVSSLPIMAYGDANFRTILQEIALGATNANWTAAGNAARGSTGKQLSILDYLDGAIATGSQASLPVTTVDYTGKQTAWDLFSNLTSQLAGGRASRADFDEFYNKLHAKESTYKSVSRGDTYRTDTTNKLDVQDFAINYIVKKLDLSDPKLSGAANSSKQRIDQLMRDNGVDKYFTAGTKAKFIRNFLTGDTTEENIQDAIRKQAMNTYTPWASQMKENPEATFADIIRPYSEQYQQTLEINGPVNISDVASLASQDQQVVSPYDFQKKLRNDQRWTTTKAANTEAADLAKSFARALGVNV